MGRNLLALMKDSSRMKKEKLYISDLFQETVAKYPNKVAIYFEDREMTFRELDEQSNRVANHFLARGLQRGDCVAIFMENCPEYLVVYLGLAKIGAISGFINHNLRHEALAHCVKISKCIGLVFSSGLSDAVSEILSDLDSRVSENCYSVGGKAELPQAKSLEQAMEGVSSSNPPAVLGKDCDGEPQNNNV